MSRFRFTLSVAGGTARSQQAYASLRRICGERLGIAERDANGPSSDAAPALPGDDGAEGGGRPGHDLALLRRPPAC